MLYIIFSFDSSLNFEVTSKMSKPFPFEKPSIFTFNLLIVSVNSGYKTMTPIEPVNVTGLANNFLPTVAI